VKSIIFSLLRKLSDGEFHSGEALAQALNVSRTSIWNALKTLEGGDIVIHKVRGRGYQLPEPMQLLDLGIILSALSHQASLFQVEILETVESTNRLLMQRAAADAPHGSCIAAEIQTQGRGRRGRTWHSGLGGGLTFSVLWRFNQGPGLLSGLSLAVGVALIRALREAGVTDATLKWPNDVLHNFRKLAGILIELQGDALGPSAAVIGIGLNLKVSDQIKDQVDQAVVDIYSVSGAAPSRSILLGQILSNLAEVLLEFEEGGFSAMQEEWSRYHAYHGKQVQLSLPNGIRHSGRVMGVAEDGSLLIETNSGLQRFGVGEISLRGVAQ
jgi:BirA family biotin operon repressor/biotin-[acetyl-CoA-carboxylase] ligase